MKRIIIIVLMLLGIGGCGGGTLFYLYSKSKKKPITYETEQPTVRDIIKKTVATGSVIPRKEVEIKPQVSGLVSKLYVEAGDIVKKGALVATVRIIPDMVSLNNAESRLNRAKINLDNAEREYKRRQQLFKEGVIAEIDFRQFELDKVNAEEEYQAAKDNLEVIKEGSTKKYRKTGNTNIRAIISGMILEVPIEEGNSVIESNTFNDGTTIATIADMNEMIFEGKVDESEVGKISRGMNLLLTIGAIEDQTFDAILEHIAPKGIEENGAIQFKIRAAVKLKENQFIRANYSANADIVLERRDSVMTIPESLLIFENDSVLVEIETAPQEFEKRSIKTGLSDGIYIEVLEGLDEDDHIKNLHKVIEKKK